MGQVLVTCTNVAEQQVITSCEPCELESNRRIMAENELENGIMEV